MTFPSIVLGLVLAALYGAIFHLWKNGGFGRLLLYLLISCVGFWVGHSIGVYLNWRFLFLGPLNAGLATVMSILFLFLGDWLSRIEIRRPGK